MERTLVAGPLTKEGDADAVDAIEHGGIGRARSIGNAAPHNAVSPQNAQ